MLRLAIQRLVVFLVGAVAFATVLFIPVVARAALLPACEDARVTVERAAAATPSKAITDECDSAADGDPESLDMKVAAMCDLRGASVVAPQRVLPIADARIEAVPGVESGASIVGSASSPHAPDSTPVLALAEHAVFAAIEIPAAMVCELGLPYLPVQGAARSAQPRGIDHPPR